MNLASAIGRAVLGRRADTPKVITYVGAGAYNSGSTNSGPGYAIPTGVQPGDLLVLSVSFKNTGVDVSSVPGWTYQADRIGGIGVDGADSGSFRAYVYTRIADGSEGASLTVTLSGSPICSQGQIVGFRKTAGTWAVTPASAVEATPATTWDESFGSALPLVSGDYVVTALAANGDVCAPNAAMLLNSAVPMTLIGNNSTTQGNDMSHGFNYLPITSQASSAVGISQAFSGTATANTPTGSVIALRLRLT
ncbi:hypothetical protein [Brevundimonas sp.]|uniref:hypothetical protein n=1 Tax=Brevundimonas sp. TaxID=1871086 RepID=UPI002638A7C2|nr:hypothetical protein [Brevundimonas sp.]